MNNNNNEDKHNKQIKQTIARMSGFAVSMVFAIIVGFLLGRFLDSKLGTTPVFLILGTILGIITVFKSIYDISKKDWDN